MASEAKTILIYVLMKALDDSIKAKTEKSLNLKGSMKVRPLEINSALALKILVKDGFWTPLYSRSFFIGQLPKELTVELGCREVPSVCKTMSPQNKSWFRLSAS